MFGELLFFLFLAKVSLLLQKSIDLFTVLLYNCYKSKVYEGVRGLTDKFKKNVIAFVAIFLTFFLGTSFSFFTKLLPDLINRVNLVGATADVGKYDLSLGERVYLTGEWDFFWNKHIISNGLEQAEPDMFVDVPASWTTYEINGEKLPNGGSASYRTYLENVKTSEPFIVSVPNVSGKCEVFINGKCVYSNRSIPGTDYSTVIESYAIPLTLEEEDSKNCEIVVEMTCTNSSGLTATPILSTYEEFHTRETSTLAQRYVYIGIVSFIAIAVILLGILNRNLSGQLWLIILCSAFAFRMLITNEGYVASHNLFGDLDYEVMTLLTYASTYIIKLAMMMHLTNVLGIKLRQGSIVFISLLFLVCTFVPYVIYDYVYIATSYIWLQSVTYILDILMIYKIAEKIVERRKFAFIYLIAYCISSAGIVIDNFYINGYISQNVTNIMPITCVLFISSVVVIHFIDTVEAFKEAHRAAELEKELSDMNMTLMLSQIQPHFMYNALNTIKYLTKKDPKSAESAIVKFSNYLRANMDSLTQKEPIPFKKEMEHVENYISIERLRFGDRLNVEYDIACDNFSIPPLTIQPIAENAIKHGINQRVDGGTLKISSYQEDKFILIKIEDDGIGFDVGEVKKDGRSHIGMNNIKSRLKEMLNADVIVESVINKGTTVTIKIPKEDIIQ